MLLFEFLFSIQSYDEFLCQLYMLVILVKRLSYLEKFLNRWPVTAIVCFEDVSGLAFIFLKKLNWTCSLTVTFVFSLVLWETSSLVSCLVCMMLGLAQY